MKSALTVVLFRLFTIGVCVDVNEESVSVTVEDSVTLKSGFTERQTDDGIEWRFSGTRIAKISSDSNEIWVKPDGPFKNRLQLDNQTGDLKISNIRTGDSGQYKLRISRLKDPPPEMIFTVKVVSADDLKPLLVGDSATLLTGLTDIQGNDEILWRFGQQKSLVAEINRAAGIFKTYDDAVDGKFRDRLKLDHQTGSLIITNTRTTDSGLYEAEIIRTSSRYTIHKTFSVTVRDAVKSVSVKKGESVTLPITEIQNDDQIQWMLGNIRLAEIHKTAKQFSIYDGPDGRFRDRLELDHQTGSLTITDTRTTDSGLYEVTISTRRYIINRRIIVTVDPRQSSAAVAGFSGVGFLLGAAAAAATGVIYYCCKKSKEELSEKQLSVLYEHLEFIHMWKEASKTQQCQSAGSDTENSQFLKKEEELYEKLVKLFKNQSQPPMDNMDMGDIHI